MGNNKIKTVPFMVDISENTLELKITAKIYTNGRIHECGTEITDLTEIRKGINYPQPTNVGWGLKLPRS